jgi:hypothetical protein
MLYSTRVIEGGIVTGISISFVTSSIKRRAVIKEQLFSNRCLSYVMEFVHSHPSMEFVHSHPSIAKLSGCLKFIKKLKKN